VGSILAAPAAGRLEVVHHHRLRIRHPIRLGDSFYGISMGGGGEVGGDLPLVGQEPAFQFLLDADKKYRSANKVSLAKRGPTQRLSQLYDRSFRLARPGVNPRQ